MKWKRMLHWIVTVYAGERDLYMGNHYSGGAAMYSRKYTGVHWYGFDIVTPWSYFSLIKYGGSGKWRMVAHRMRWQTF